MSITLHNSSTKFSSVQHLLLLLLLLVLSISSTVKAYTCFGLHESSPLVCNGNGRCILDDFCSCNPGVTTLDCSTSQCGWVQGSFGAPRPTVTATVDSNQRVLISVVVAKKPGVQHRIGFRENLECAQDDTKIVPNADWKLEESSTCFVRYMMNRTLQDHLNDEEVAKDFGEGDFFQAISPIFASYLDFSDGSCQMTTFKTEWTLNILLQAVSTATFAGTNDPFGKIRQDRIRTLPDGKLEIVATVGLTVPGIALNFTFASSSIPGLTLVVRSKLYDERCGYDTRPNCVYVLTLVSTSSFKDYSGKYHLLADFQKVFDDGNVYRQLDISFKLQYAVPIPPAATNLNLTTKSSLYSPDFLQSKSVFSTTDYAWMLTEIVEKVTIPNRALAYKNVYVCCMEDRGPIPEYNPAQGKYGCANKTENMAIWAPLISNEVPLSSYEVTVRKLVFLDDKIGLSFSVLRLTGQNRVCYLQVETFLKAKTSRRSGMEVATTDATTDATIVSYTPLQFLSNYVYNGDLTNPDTQSQNPAPAPSPSPTVVKTVTPVPDGPTSGTAEMKSRLHTTSLLVFLSFFLVCIFFL